MPGKYTARVLLLMQIVKPLKDNKGWYKELENLRCHSDQMNIIAYPKNPNTSNIDDGAQEKLNTFRANLTTLSYNIFEKVSEKVDLNLARKFGKMYVDGTDIKSNEFIECYQQLISPKHSDLQNLCLKVIRQNNIDSSDISKTLRSNLGI